MFRIPKSAVDIGLALYALALAIIIGIAQNLISPQRDFSWGREIGRAVLVAVFAYSASGALVFFPHMSRSAEFGLAAFFASLGTTGVVGLIDVVLRIRRPE